jgi:hypothetical protein
MPPLSIGSVYSMAGRSLALFALEAEAVPAK